MLKRILLFCLLCIGAINIALACDTDQIDTGTSCETTKFTVTTTELENGDVFKFKIGARGTFYVDCGDDGVLSDDATTTTVSGNTITRSNMTNVLYTCTYSQGGVKTIRFGGVATQYSSSVAAIDFYSSATPKKVASLDGSLGALFPYKNEAPIFKSTFKGCSSLTSLPEELFHGITGNQDQMFSETFSDCTGLTSLPEGLFDNITTAKLRMFNRTFYACTGLTSLPNGLFKNVAGAQDATFYGTFRGCTNLASIPGDTFASISGSYNRLFEQTFYDCRSLTSLPNGLFAGVSGSATYLFDSTFYNCSGLTSLPDDLFSGITSSSESLFQNTFVNCGGLTSIPADLFKNVSGSAVRLFSGTFQSCKKLTSIPENLFGKISGSAELMFNQTFYACSGLTSIPSELFAGVSGSGTQMFRNTFGVCSSLTSLPPRLFSGVTTGGYATFDGTFTNCTGLGGYIPPSTFSGLIAAGSPAGTNMWTNTFTNTKLKTSCPTGTTQYTTGYEGSVANTTWNGKVSCVDYSDQVCASGEYLPRYNDACVSCPTGYVCPGGTFTFDTTTDQGIHKFTLNTTNLSANATFDFDISARGTFTVDCGDGGVLSDNAATTTVSGNTITKSDTTSVTYTCTWTDAGVHKIRFDGAGTGYGTTNSSSAIRFWVGADDNEKDTNAAKVRAIDGSLSSLFPATGTANGQIPNFYYTFRGASLTTLPANLFSGYTTGTNGMFAETFRYCTSLTALPSGLFSSFTSSAYNMFGGTFEGCSALQSVPATLFSGLTHGAEFLFNATFRGCTSLTSLPAGLFANFTTGANYMFYDTFRGCSNLTGYIPANFFGGFISNNVSYATLMMDNIFLYTNLATSCDSYNGTERYYTPYDSYWDSKVSCAPANTGYYVTYACGTGSGTAPTDSKQYANGYNVTTVAGANNTCIAPSNSIFTGWSCGGNTVNAGSTFNISANTTCTAQWSECTACAATNASCELSVVNNTCTYTTTCNTHYGNIQNNGEYNASCSINSYTCSSGEYLPAEGEACETCPRGYTCAGGTYNYNANDDQGIVINTYTCSSGQYLPANGLACETCPTGHTCSGGTFNFNAKDFQGLVLDTDSPIPANTNVCAENFPPSLKATYDINTYTCSPGYYLPADAIECVKCLENNYCVGGSYTFNSTTDQGITHCSGDLRAPQGMWEAEQCGRRFNVGGKYVYSRSTRKTSPSINLDMDLNGTTEFYISLSKIPVPMNVDFANLSQHNKLVIDLPKAYVNSVGVNVPAGKYYAYDDTMTYDLSTLDYTISPTDYGVETSTKTWHLDSSYGVISGEALCSVTAGSGMYKVGTPDETTPNGQNCWCKVTRYTPDGSNITYLPRSPNTWVYHTISGGFAGESCENICVQVCGYRSKYEDFFRHALFGQANN